MLHYAIILLENMTEEKIYLAVHFLFQSLEMVCKKENQETYFALPLHFKFEIQKYIFQYAPNLLLQ